MKNINPSAYMSFDYIPNNQSCYKTRLGFNEKHAIGGKP